MKFVAGRNGRNPEKNLSRLCSVDHETQMAWPRRKLGTPAVGGEHLTMRVNDPPYSFMHMHKYNRVVATVGDYLH